jgi:hypothetical protein
VSANHRCRSIFSLGVTCVCPAVCAAGMVPQVIKVLMVMAEPYLCHHLQVSGVR